MGKKRGKKKATRAKQRPKSKPPRKKSVRAPKQKTNAKPKKRKATKRVVRKTQRQRNNPPKDVTRRKSPTKRKSPSKTRRKTSSQKSRTLSGTKLSGNSTRIRVDSRYAGKNVTIIRKTTRVSPGIKIPRGKRGPKLLQKALQTSALNHFENIGTSIKDYYYVRIQYSFTMKGKKVISHFSTGIAKIKNESQFAEYLQDVLESFAASLIGYSRGGFQNIQVTGVIVQGYEK